MNRTNLIKVIILGIISLNFISFFQLETIQANTIKSLIITEIGAFETSEYEWIEIYNNTDSAINLQNLYFIENAIKHKTTLVQGSNMLDPFEYAIIANNAASFTIKYPDFLDQTILDSSWSSLSESGEPLNLEFNGILGEEFTYSPTLKDKSLERIIIDSEYQTEWQPCNSTHSLFSQSSQALPTEEDTEEITDEINEEITDPPITETPVPTPTEDPIVEDTSEQEVSEIKKEQILYISEVNFKNSTEDWIELLAINEINLDDNYKLKIDSSTISISTNNDQEFPQHIVINKDLVGTTEQILLLQNETIIDAICWENGSPTQSELNEQNSLFENFSIISTCHNSELIEINESLARTIFNQFLLGSDYFTKFPHSTKNEFNLTKNTAPNGTISIQSGKLISDSSISLNLTGENSTDAENDTLTYYWDFGNGETSTKPNPDTTTYTKIGTYLVKLIVTDSLDFNSQATLQVQITDKPQTTKSEPKPEKSSSNIQAAKPTTNNIDPNVQNLIIKNFLANPEGEDTKSEFITIYNPTTTSINLEGLYLDDGPEGSSPYLITNKQIASNQELTFYNSETKISLNNSNDSVRLLDENKKTISEIKYQTTKEGQEFINQSTETTTNKTETKNDEKSSSSKTTGFKNSLLRITEIVPNPKGADTGNEWIEIYNPSEQDTPLINWTLQIGSKKLTLTDEILKAKTYNQIFITKHSLPNQNGKITLTDYTETKIDEINYQKSEEGKSYSLIGTEFLWTDLLSPKLQNPEKIIINGTVSSIIIEEQALVITDSKNKTHKMFYRTKPPLNIKDKVTVEAFKTTTEHGDSLELTRITKNYDTEPTNSDKKSPIIPLIGSVISISTIAIFRNQIATLLKYFNL